MKKNLLISLWFTLVTTVMFGLIYPLAVTGLSQLLFPGKANGQLIEKTASWLDHGLSDKLSPAPATSIHARQQQVRETDTIPLPAAVRIWGPRTKSCSTASVVTYKSYTGKIRARQSQSILSPRRAQACTRTLPQPPLNSKFLESHATAIP